MTDEARTAGARRNPKTASPPAAAVPPSAAAVPPPAASPPQEAATAQRLAPGSGPGQGATGWKGSIPAVVLMAILLGTIIFGAVTVVPALLNQSLNSKDGMPAEVALTLWLVIGAGVILVLLMAVALMSNFVIGNRATPGPLGLPNGSVSAILALMLLLIFSISSLYLYNQVRAGEGVGSESTGVTQQLLGQFPQDRILYTRVENPGADPAARTYTVSLSASHPSSLDLARNISLTVGTLLSAVAGFYFGQRASQGGSRAAREGSAGDAGGARGGLTLSPNGSRVQ